MYRRVLGNRFPRNLKVCTIVECVLYVYTVTYISNVPPSSEQKSFAFVFGLILSRSRAKWLINALPLIVNLISIVPYFGGPLLEYKFSIHQTI